MILVLYQKRLVGVASSMKFTHKGVYYTPNIGETEVFLPYVDIQTKNKYRAMMAANDKVGYEINIVVRKENCSDGMSDNTYPYSINLEFADSNRTGCGG